MSLWLSPGPEHGTHALGGDLIIPPEQSPEQQAGLGTTYGTLVAVIHLAHCGTWYSRTCNWQPVSLHLLHAFDHAVRILSTWRLNEPVTFSVGKSGSLHPSSLPMTCLAISLGDHSQCDHDSGNGERVHHLCTCCVAIPLCGLAVHRVAGDKSLALLSTQSFWLVQALIGFCNLGTITWVSWWWLLSKIISRQGMLVSPYAV